MRLSVVFALALGCSAPGPLALTPAEYDPLTMSLTPLSDGADLHLQIPPQGGAVLFIGAQADNLSGDPVELGARLEVDGMLVGEDRRTSTFKRVGGHFVPALESYVAMPNVPVCPAGGLVANGRPSTLAVTLTDGDRSARVVFSVTPRCLQPDAAVSALCNCECAADFMPGMCP